MSCSPARQGMCYGVPCGYTLWNSGSCSSAPQGASVTGYSRVFFVEQLLLFLSNHRDMAKGMSLGTVYRYY